MKRIFIITGIGAVAITGALLATAPAKANFDEQGVVDTLANHEARIKTNEDNIVVLQNSQQTTTPEAPQATPIAETDNLPSQPQTAVSDPSPQPTRTTKTVTAVVKCAGCTFDVEGHSWDNYTYKFDDNSTYRAQYSNTGSPDDTIGPVLVVGQVVPLDYPEHE